MFTPTEFTNLDMDEEGFIYATNGQDRENVKKLNAQGNDILRREGYQLRRVTSAIRSDGPSRLIDIDVGDSDIYSVLDCKGRIFTYNGDGYLLYVFGGMGNRMGQFNTPVALERLEMRSSFWIRRWAKLPCSRQPNTDARSTKRSQATITVMKIKPLLLSADDDERQPGIRVCGHRESTASPRQYAEP